jgi:hypothetical protein
MAAYASLAGARMPEVTQVTRQRYNEGSQAHVQGQGRKGMSGICRCGKRATEFSA